MTPPSDFLFSRLLAAVKTKRKIKSLALCPFFNLTSGSWIHKRLLCLKRGPRSLLRPLKAMPCLVAPKHEGHLKQHQILRVAPKDLLCHGRRLMRNRDRLCLGEETTFSTAAAWAIGSSAVDSFHPGLEAVCQGERWGLHP